LIVCVLEKPDRPRPGDLAARSTPPTSPTVFERGARWIFRIDHYLGKETVQNLIALRFANTLFEPLWNNLTIDHVQITVAETEGVGDRWPYYDEYGALRDMLQNHMLQLLCLVAMEPPSDLDPDSVRNEKVKVLRSLRPFTREPWPDTVRGQYVAGVVEGRPPRAMSRKRGQAPTPRPSWPSAPTSTTGAGRRAVLPAHRQAPAREAHPDRHPVQAVPHSIFGGNDRTDEVVANRLVIDLQPDEDIS
jgi:glucose-6-phosphate 1-dehydrogenase